MGSTKVYDLEDRTTHFGENIIEFALAIPRNTITAPLVSQLVRSGTSIGANYLEANDTITSKDFCYRIGICRREARETGYWLKMLVKALPDLTHQASVLRQESLELNKIFSAIVRRKRET